MKNNKGFIQIPLLIIVIAGVTFFGTAGYFGVKQYQSYKTEKDKQTNALAEAKAEIDKLKTASDATQKEQMNLENKLNQTKSNTIASSNADNSYSKVPISSVVQLFCTQNPNGIPDFNKASSGSGTFVSDGSGIIITNAHVINNDDTSTCAVFLRDIKNTSKPRSLFAEVFAVVANSDIAFLRPKYLMTDEQGNFTEGLVGIPTNYSYPKKSVSCKEEDIKLGSKLVVVGYPAVGGSSVTLTEGIVSGFDGQYIKTSAKIERGNSGGGAFLLPSGCWIGVPTASTVGGIESLGRILRWDGN